MRVDDRAAMVQIEMRPGPVSIKHRPDLSRNPLTKRLIAFQLTVRNERAPTPRIRRACRSGRYARRSPSPGQRRLPGNLLTRAATFNDRSFTCLIGLVTCGQLPRWTPRWSRRLSARARIASCQSHTLPSPMRYEASRLMFVPDARITKYSAPKRALFAAKIASPNI